MIRRMTQQELRIRRQQLLRELLENCKSGEELEILKEFESKRGLSRCHSVKPLEHRDEATNATEILAR